MLFASIPYKVLPQFHRQAFEQVKERDKAFYDRLAAAGFMLDFGDDESGLFLKYVRSGSGYSIDVGACELIADGTIKLKSGARQSVAKGKSVSVCVGLGGRRHIRKNNSRSNKFIQVSIRIHA